MKERMCFYFFCLLFNIILGFMISGIYGVFVASITMVTTGIFYITTTE